MTGSASEKGNTTLLNRNNLYRKVLSKRNLTENTFVLRFERKGLEFLPGQYLSVGVADDLNMREYSIYSSVHADYLEILVKKVEKGLVSKRLAALEAGDRVYIEGPFGFFLIDETMKKQPLYFIASGTGLSPFHCFANSYSDLNYTLLHGVKTKTERYERESFENLRYIDCLSKEKDGTFSGRVTDWLSQNTLDTEGHFFLCGNCDMIYQSYDILASKGIPAERIYAEVYF